MAQANPPSEADSRAAEAASLADALWPALNALRVPLAIAAFVSIVLIVPDQVREIYRVLAQERLNEPWHHHWLLATGSLLALSFVLWQVARLFANLTLAADGTSPRLAAVLLDWGPRVIAALPLVGAAAGVYASRTPPLPSSGVAINQDVLAPIQAQLAQLSTDFRLGALLMLALAGAMLLLTTIFEKLIIKPAGRNSHKLAVLNLWLLFPAAVLASIVYMLSQPVALPQYFGAIPIFALWVVNVAVVLTLLSRYYSVAGIPMTILLMIWLVLVELGGLADNHEFRHGAASSPPLARPDIATVFRDWISRRQDRSAYDAQGKPYPVYIVAAEGGGLYAAFQTGKFLSRMQDICPGFAQHVFSISGVSGGSLGAAVFTSLAKQTAKNGPPAACRTATAAQGPLEARAATSLSGDLLSPVIWAALFPDFLQRFLPFPVPAFDRARALEYAFEAAWDKAGDPNNPLNQPFFSLCGDDLKGCTEGATPLLAINTTNVETGMQMVLSPADFREIGPPWTNTGRLYDFFTLGDVVPMNLSTAVGLGARFPWVSPGGWYEFNSQGVDSQMRRARATFADGAYVDNSGVATAQKLIRYLNAIIAKEPDFPKVEFKLVMISAALVPFDRLWIDGLSDATQSELLFPLKVALAAQQGRGYTVQEDASAESIGYTVSEAAFYYSFMPLPLGWQLSNLSRQYIDLFAGDPQKCDLAQLQRSLASQSALVGSYINRANCVAAGIVSDLTPSAAPSIAPVINSTR